MHFFVETIIMGGAVITTTIPVPYCLAVFAQRNAMSITVAMSFSLAALLFVHLIENRNAETIKVGWNKPDLADRRLVL